MIEVGASKSSCNFAARLAPSEQENVTCVRQRFELFLAHIIKLPWFLHILANLMVLVSLAMLDVELDAVLPLFACTLVRGLEFEESVYPDYLD